MRIGSGPLQSSMRAGVLTKQQRNVIVSIQHRGDFEIAEIARHAGESVATTRYVLSVLEERGILLSISPFISVYPLNLVSMTLYLSFVGLSDAKHQALLKEVIGNPSVAWVGRLAGAFEYAVAVLTRRGEEVHRVIEQITGRYGNVISRKAVATTCGFYAQARRYLAPRVCVPEPLYFGFNDPLTTIDDVDRRILAELAEKGMTSNRRLAEELDLSHTTLARRTRELRDKRIIKGIIARFDMSRLNLNTYRILLYTSGSRPEITKQIQKFSESEPHILRTMEILGPWDYEIELEVPSVIELSDFIRRLKQKFEGAVVQVETVQILLHLSFKPFPRIARESQTSHPSASAR